MIRKLARAAVRYQSVREELGVAGTALRRAVRSLRMEWFSQARELRECVGVKLNVGCGALIREGWMNVDLYPRPGAFYLDVLNGLPFGSATVQHIHCEHFVEHLAFDQAERFFAECYRVLVPAGTLRIIVPDAEKYILAYSRNDQTFFGKLPALGNAQTPLDTPIKVINQMFRMGGDHKFAWDFATLALTAKAVGFSTVTKSCFGENPADQAIDGTDEWRCIESLYAVLRK